MASTFCTATIASAAIFSVCNIQVVESKSSILNCRSALPVQTIVITHLALEESHAFGSQARIPMFVSCLQRFFPISDIYFSLQTENEGHTTPLQTCNATTTPTMLQCGHHVFFLLLQALKPLIER